jgi:hypothetical protein
MQTSQNGKLAFTVTWRARDGEADACANIIARFLPEARKEPGVELVTVNRGVWPIRRSSCSTRCSATKPRSRRTSRRRTSSG